MTCALALIPPFLVWVESLNMLRYHFLDYVKIKQEEDYLDLPLESFFLADE